MRWKMLVKRLYTLNFLKQPESLILSFILFRVTMKELKSFLSRINCKMITSKLLEHFNGVDVRQRGELRFDDFLRLYQKLLTSPTVINLMVDEMLEG